jgi:hypothetical protein
MTFLRDVVVHGDGTCLRLGEDSEPNINSYTGIIGTVKSVGARTILTRGAAKSGLNPSLEEGSFKFSRIYPAYMLN